MKNTETKKSQKNAKKEAKNSKKLQKTDKNTKKHKKQKGFLWFLGVSAIAVVLLLCCQFLFENTLTGKEKFYENTKINGIDVGGMSVAEAENVVLTDMLEARKDVEIELTSKDKSWVLEGKDFEVSNKLQPIIAEISRYGKDGNFFQNLKKENQIKKEGKDFQISYTNVLSDIDAKLDEIISEVEQESVAASLVFDTTKEFPFFVDEGQNAILVNRDKLYQEIDNALKSSKKVSIEIPIFETENEFDVEGLKNSVIKRSEFVTNYDKSSQSRKSNICQALLKFNGMIVQPGETISFNEVTGPRTEENGYKNAHILVGGVYVDGVGGGVCQASTTLYNALLLADVEILTVNHHTIPASYVPLSFDAMVSGGYSDLVFKNNLDNPIYIRTSCDSSNVKVEIYGAKFDDGITQIKQRSELVKVLTHNGDKIVGDVKGEYSNKVLYKGEYYRVKYPREGYESKGYLQYYKDGELAKEKEVRHDFYPAQEGIVVEGVEDIGEGMVVPASDVKIIKPQKHTNLSQEGVRAKLEKTNPTESNP
ncbi:MAG: VanW family protein [Clostridia bacterium]|nr:VanW family protein [Clostridia bacterium]